MKSFFKYVLFLSLFIAFTGCIFTPPQTFKESYQKQIIPSDPIATEPMYRATMKPYTVMGKKYHPTVVKLHDTFRGVASWYGDDFHNKQTSNGEYYNMYDSTAAHKTLPINTIVKVTNLSNNLTTTVRINDRGPFVDNRIIDLSYKAAKDIDMIKHGTTLVKLEIMHFDDAANKYMHKKHQTQEPKKQYNAKEEQQIITGGEYIIQIASLSFKDKALRLKQTCYNANNRYNVLIQEKSYNNQTIYKVMLTGFKSVQEAKDFIKQAQYKDAFIVRR